MIAGGFLFLLLIGVPVAFVLALTALLYIVVSGNLVLLESYPQQFFGGLENYGLLALPLFILVGECMNEGGIARRLMAMASAMIGAVRGGLAYVNLLSNMMMASILGSTVAQITIMTRVAVPEMESQGYSRESAVTLTAVGGLLAPIIPPSMMFVIFGVISQISIGDLFIAGIIPGLMLGVVFFALIGWMARRHDFPTTPRLSFRQRCCAVLEGLPAGLIPLTIVGSILGGLATPTEAAALACIAAIVIGKFVYRELTLRSLWPALVRTAQNATLVLILIAAAQVFSWVITYENIPAVAAAAIQQASASPLVFLLLVSLAMLLVGMVLDPIPALILVVPVLLPIATEVYGVSPFHFGVVVCLNLVLGLLTPPVGSALFTAAAMSGVRAEKIAWLSIPYLAGMLVVLLLLIAFPFLATALIG